MLIEQFIRKMLKHQMVHRTSLCAGKLLLFGEKPWSWNITYSISFFSILSGLRQITLLLFPCLRQIRLLLSSALCRLRLLVPFDLRQVRHPDSFSRPDFRKLAVHPDVLLHLPRLQLETLQLGHGNLDRHILLRFIRIHIRFLRTDLVPDLLVIAHTAVPMLQILIA